MAATTVTIENCTILTVNKLDHHYADGRVVIEAGRIKAIGPREQIVPEGEVVCLGGSLVMPGLVNTHTHSHSSIFRSLADDMYLMDWLNKGVWPLERSLTKSRMAAAVRLSCLEYLKGGMTTIADQIYFPDVVAEATWSSGIRSFLAASVFSGKGPAPETDDTFRDAQRFIEGWQGREEETRIYPCIGPHAPYSVDENLLRAVIKYADEKNLLIHTHISETADENQMIESATGMSPTAWLESLGFFDAPVLAAHSIHLNDEDRSIYWKNGVAVAYNPISNLKLVSGIMNLSDLWKRGVAVGIGTDGAQSNNSMDLLRDLRTGSLIQKQALNDPTFFTARQAVRMATIEGARALRFDHEIGSLEEGKRADLIVLDMTSPRFTPMHRDRVHNLYSLIAYAALGPDVKSLMIDGQWVMRDRTILTFDEGAVRQAGQLASEGLLADQEDAGQE